MGMDGRINNARGFAMFVRYESRYLSISGVKTEVMV
jgi:hypothetical protein